MSETTMLLLYAVNFTTRTLIPLMVGIYVFWDCRRRGMRRLLWVPLSVLLPSLLGFIIYLFLRNDAPMRCASCGAHVSMKDTVCVHCGAKLRLVCGTCGAEVEENFVVCPYCEAKLPERKEKIEMPNEEKNGIGKLVIAMISIPLLLILIVWGSERIGEMMDGGHNLACMSTESYLSSRQSSEIEDWLADCTDEDTVYMLRYKTRNDEGDRNTWYLIYAPAWKCENAERLWSSASKDGILGTTMSIHLKQGEGGKGSRIFTIRRTGADFQRLRIYLDGKLLEVSVTEVDYHLGVMDIVERKD